MLVPNNSRTKLIIQELGNIEKYKLRLALDESLPVKKLKPLGTEDI